MLRIVVLFIFIYLGLADTVISQKVFTVSHASQADVILYETSRKSEADILIYKVDYASQVNPVKGFWLDVAYASKADWKIYWTNYRMQAECSVYFVRYRSQARANDCYLRESRKKG